MRRASWLASPEWVSHPWCNALIPDLDIQTGALSRVTGKGTHTTTTTIMYSLPGGGSLLDSPGVWEYGLWQIDQAGPGPRLQ